LDTTVEKEGSISEKKGVGSLACKTCKGRVDLAAGAGVENLDLQPDGASSHFHVSHYRFGGLRVGSIDEHGNTNGTASATSARSSSSRFADTSAGKKLIPVRLPPGGPRGAAQRRQLHEAKIHGL